MAVKSFLPFYDVKKTVEKQVKPKPSIRDLTTVESEGTTTYDELDFVTQHKILESEYQKTAQPQKREPKYTPQRALMLYGKVVSLTYQQRLKLLAQGISSF